MWPKLKQRKGVAAMVLGVLALLGLAWHLTHGKQSAAGRWGGAGGPPATTVGVATAERMDIPLTLDALGTVNAAATVTVHAQVSGVLQKILFHEGQMVRAGQVLAQIDPRPFQMALMQAQGQLQRDEAQLQAAKVTLERYQTLQKQDSIARQDVDTQAALVQQLAGTVRADQAAEGTAKINLGYSSITAPVAGRVGLRAVDVGNVVNPSDANGLVLITQISPIQVVFAIPQDQVGDVAARSSTGQKMPVTVWDRSRTTVLDTGSFAALDNQVDVQTGTVKAKARFDNAHGQLFPSQFVNVRVQLGTVPHAVVVPVTAIRHADAGDFVYVLNAAARTVAQRPVVRGHATDDKVEIVSGLKVGEQVITEGADRLKDGSRVVLPGDKPQSKNQSGPEAQSPSGSGMKKGAWPHHASAASAPASAAAAQN